MLALTEIAPKNPRPPFWATRAERVTEPDQETHGAWHVLLVTPGQETLAASHLAGRGFGVYVPMRRALVVGPAIEACHPAPELAGYLLAFLWASDVHRARHCPGVTGVLLKTNGDPAILSDGEVRQLREAEAANDALLDVWGIARPGRKPRRRRRKSRRIGRG
jgi:hypothetical protein